MKKQLFVMLTLVFVFLLLAACQKSGVAETTLPGPAPTQPDGTQSAPTETETQAVPEPETLWGKTVTAEAVEIPQRALLSESSRAVALAPDGKHLLCVGYGDAPYLCNLVTGTVTKVTPGDEAAEEFLRERLYLMSLLGKTQEEVEAYRKEHPELETVSGAELMRQITVRSNSVLTATPYAPQTEGNYLVVMNNSAGFSGAIDCGTGKLYLAPLQTTCVGVTNDWLICRQPGRSEVTLRSAKLGWTREKDFSFALPDADYAPILGAAGLPDGGLCAVVGGKMDLEKGQPIVLAVLRSDGGREVYDLGLGYNADSYTVVAADADSILICSENRLNPVVYLVRRSEARVSLLWSGSNGAHAELLSAPLADCLNADGMPDLSDRVNGSPILRVVGRLGDGMTALLYDSEAACSILLFRPGEMKVTPLLERDASYIPILGRLTGNGYDLWFDAQADRTHLFRLTVG